VSIAVALAARTFYPDYEVSKEATMLRWKLLLLAAMAGGLTVTAQAQRINFQSARSPVQPSHAQQAFPREAVRPPTMNFQMQRPFVASPRHITPFPSAAVFPAPSQFNPSSILRPQPPTRFIFMNPFRSFYPYSPYGSYLPWSYSGPGYLPYGNPYAYPYGSTPNGYGGYPGYGNNYGNPYAGMPPAITEPPTISSQPPTVNMDQNAHLTSPADAAKRQPPLSSQVAVTLDGKSEPRPALTHPLIVGSGQHTLVIAPRPALATH
jgi:hypothetical protein